MDCRENFQIEVKKFMPSILNNAGTRMSLGQLNKNISKVGQAIAKLNSGQKITSAAVDAASFSIGARMLQQLRALERDSENTQNGQSMFKVASGGIEEIVENIKRLKELAIDAANDSNSDLDRATIQKEFDQKRMTIDEIVYSAEYNGKVLLDGTYSRRVSASGTTEIEEGLFEPIETADSRTEPPGTPTMITNDMLANGSILTLSDEDAVYQLANDLNTCTLNVTSSNVKIIGASSARDVSINMQNPASLWIENFKMSTTQNRSAITFNGVGSFLHMKGSNSIRQTGSGNAAGIQCKGSTTFFGENETGSAGSLDIYQGNGVCGGGIGSNQSDKNNRANVTIMSGSYHMEHYSGGGTNIGAGIGGNMGGITIYDGNFDLHINAIDPSIGADLGSRIGRIIVYGGNVSAKGDLPGSGSRYIVGTYSSGDVVEAVQFYGGTIYVENKPGNRSVMRTADVPPEGFSDNDRVYSISLPNVSPEESSTVHHTSSRRVDDYDNPLRIHHGPKSNNLTNFYINDMRTTALRGQVPNEEDRQRLEKMSVKQARDYQRILDEASGKTLADVSVLTQHEAEVAIRVVDGALEYALDVATSVGAYIERLEYTQSNIETNSENTQASESTIMDADMAKEMTEYTKSNILSQSSQSMLAQANQDLSSVLSLLQ